MSCRTRLSLCVVVFLKNSCLSFSSINPHLGGGHDPKCLCKALIFEWHARHCQLPAFLDLTRNFLCSMISPQLSHGMHTGAPNPAGPGTVVKFKAFPRGSVLSSASWRSSFFPTGQASEWSIEIIPAGRGSRNSAGVFGRNPCSSFMQSGAVFLHVGHFNHSPSVSR